MQAGITYNKSTAERCEKQACSFDAHAGSRLRRMASQRKCHQFVHGSVPGLPAARLHLCHTRCQHHVHCWALHLNVPHCVFGRLLLYILFHVKLYQCMQKQVRGPTSEAGGTESP